MPIDCGTRAYGPPYRAILLSQPCTIPAIPVPAPPVTTVPAPSSTLTPSLNIPVAWSVRTGTSTTAVDVRRTPEGRGTARSPRRCPSPARTAAPSVDSPAEPTASQLARRTGSVRPEPGPPSAAPPPRSTTGRCSAPARGPRPRARRTSVGPLCGRRRRALRCAARGHGTSPRPARQCCSERAEGEGDLRQRAARYLVAGAPGHPAQGRHPAAVLCRRSVWCAQDPGGQLGQARRHRRGLRRALSGVLRV